MQFAYRPHMPGSMQPLLVKLGICPADTPFNRRARRYVEMAFHERQRDAIKLARREMRLAQIEREDFEQVRLALMSSLNSGQLSRQHRVEGVSIGLSEVSVVPQRYENWHAPRHGAETVLPDGPPHGAGFN